MALVVLHGSQAPLLLEYCCTTQEGGRRGSSLLLMSRGLRQRFLEDTLIGEGDREAAGSNY
jgi:hypothetical protein